MPNKYTRIPVTLKCPEEQAIALTVKQAMETKEGRALSWAHVVRLAFIALAEKEKVNVIK